MKTRNIYIYYIQCYESEKSSENKKIQEIIK